MYHHTRSIHSITHRSTYQSFSSACKLCRQMRTLIQCVELSPWSLCPSVLCDFAFRFGPWFLVFPLCVGIFFIAPDYLNTSFRRNGAWNSIQIDYFDVPSYLQNISKSCFTLHSLAVHLFYHRLGTLAGKCNERKLAQENLVACNLYWRYLESSVIVVLISFLCCC